MSRLADCYLTLEDANGRERDNPRPWLEFDRITGRIIIADDYETSNDPAARDFVLDKSDVLKFAAALLDYALHGTTTTTECCAQHDVEDRLQNGV